MKRNRLKRHLRMILCIVALSLVMPFAVFSQSEAGADLKPEASENAASREITLVIEGTIQGGRFFFKENTIQFDTLNKYVWPIEDIIVNGTPWKDPAKPFKLGFTPDFAKAVILEKTGGPDGGRTYLLPREKMFALMIVPHEKDPEAVPFRVKLAVKNQVLHDGLPPDETPSAGGTSKRASVIAPRREQQKSASAAASEERFPLVLAGEIEGRGKFQFRSNVIEYRPESEIGTDYPEKVTVNGKSWEDLHTPFILDFVTDYTSGKLADRSGTASTGWRGFPVGSSLFDRFEGAVGELSVIGAEKGKISTFRAEISLRKLPQDYVARILAMLNNGQEKNRKGSLESAYLADPARLSPDDREKVEQWREERRKEQLVWTQDRSYSTDGKELPYLTRTAVPSLPDSNPNQFDVTIEAVLDYSAEFAFLGNKIIYSDQSYPNAGKYPRQVKINGSAWRNLHQPFTLESEIDADSIVGTSVETEYYRYYLRPERNRVVLGIVNHGPRDEEHVRIRLTLKKKASPANRK